MWEEIGWEEALDTIAAHPSIRTATIQLLTRGKLKLLFIGRVFLVGLIIPLLLIAVSYFTVGNVEYIALFVSGLLVIFGVFMQRVVILKAAMRPSLI